MKTIFALSALIATIFGIVAYDQSEHTHTYHLDWTFSGHKVVVERGHGALGFRHDEKIIGYFLSGRPRVVGFGCEGTDGVLIAVEEDYLPRCKRVEGIVNADGE